MMKVLLGILMFTIGSFYLGWRLGDLMAYFAESNFNFLGGIIICATIWIIGLIIIASLTSKLLRN